ncbi:hypothetical protein KFK09_014288 [Dendrobium nobile]|uniref:Secreted protein n=1 Tax=Dendrobium nobile TaxID=94219 RepID=A0A8T3BB97_DENNO|nr:hypothetical protein KFK09_014288 [Dendrobium nobile]
MSRLPLPVGFAFPLMHLFVAVLLCLKWSSERVEASPPPPTTLFLSDRNSHRKLAVKVTIFLHFRASSVGFATKDGNRGFISP